jgi:hypothetical protein
MPSGELRLASKGPFGSIAGVPIVVDVVSRFEKD